MGVLLDTNVILDHLKFGFLITTPPTVDLFTSVINEVELLRYPGLSLTEVSKIKQFLSLVTVLPLTSPIAQRAALLGRTRRPQLPDLIIAATALHYNLDLITRNFRDFKNIHGLRVRESI